MVREFFIILTGKNSRMGKKEWKEKLPNQPFIDYPGITVR
jgi:hypothetical protein